jgi:hypothetical protein
MTHDPDMIQSYAEALDGMLAALEGGWLNNRHKPGTKTATCYLMAPDRAISTKEFIDLVLEIERAVLEQYPGACVEFASREGCCTEDVIKLIATRPYTKAETQADAEHKAREAQAQADRAQKAKEAAEAQATYDARPEIQRVRAKLQDRFDLG